MGLEDRRHEQLWRGKPLSHNGCMPRCRFHDNAALSQDHFLAACSRMGATALLILLSVAHADSRSHLSLPLEIGCGIQDRLGIAALAGNHFRCFPIASRESSRLLAKRCFPRLQREIGYLPYFFFTPAIVLPGCLARFSEGWLRLCLRRNSGRPENRKRDNKQDGKRPDRVSAVHDFKSL